MIIETSSLRTVVQIFEVIVRSNTLINNQRYTHFDDLHREMLKIKKIYQDLIRCVISMKQKAFEKVFQEDNNSNLNEKDFHKQNEIDDVEANALTKVFFAATNFNFDFDSELNFLSIIFKVTSKNKTKKKQRDRKSKRNKFKSLLSSGKREIRPWAPE